jgi:hypothetical protein
VRLGTRTGFPRIFVFPIRKYLTDAGESSQLAEATAAVFKEAVGEGEFPSKPDMLRLEHKFDLVVSDLGLRRGILAIIAVGMVLPAIQKLF